MDQVIVSASMGIASLGILVASVFGWLWMDARKKRDEAVKQKTQADEVAEHWNRVATNQHNINQQLMQDIQQQFRKAGK